MSKFGTIILAVITLFLLFGVGVYNRIVGGDENVTASWSEVVNQYQGRVDLMPNLVSTIKDLAEQEKEALTFLVEARAQATSVKVSPETLNNPAVFSQFSNTQNQLDDALKRLLATVAHYPSLQSDKSFLELQAQLAGVDNDIIVARKRYIDAVEDYNLTVIKFPGNIIASALGYSVKPNFSVADEGGRAMPLKVNFDTAPTTN